MDGDQLIATMAALLPYAATEDSRPVLHGIHLNLGSPVTMAASDGFRATYQKLTENFSSGGDNHRAGRHRLNPD